MTKYIAFLRGINVGNIRIKMTDLKAAFEKVGYHNVVTYLQTGNVVFESDQAMPEIKKALETGLSDTFKYEAYVLLYEFEALTDIIKSYPLERDERHHAYVIFIENKVTLEALETLSKSVGDEANLIISGSQVLYWKVPIGDSLSTAFAKIIAKSKYKATTTVRNINTLEKMM